MTYDIPPEMIEVLRAVETFLFRLDARLARIEHALDRRPSSALDEDERPGLDPSHGRTH